MIWNYAYNRPLEQLQRKTINPKFFRIEVGKWLRDMKNHWSHIESESEEERLAKEKAINQNIRSAMNAVGYDLDKFMLSHAYYQIEDSYARRCFLFRVCFEHSPSRTFMPHNFDENEGGNIRIFSKAEDMRWGDRKDVTDADILCRYFFCETEEDIWDIFADGVGDIRDLCHYYTNKEKAMRMLLYIYDDDDKLLKALTGKTYKVCPNSVKEEIVSILKDEFFDGMRDDFFNENNYDRALLAWETGIPAIRNEFVRDNHAVDRHEVILNPVSIQ